jgi:hypothetical protein
MTIYCSAILANAGYYKNRGALSNHTFTRLLLRVTILPTNESHRLNVCAISQSSILLLAFAFAFAS